MAKVKTVFVCSECGYESPKWLGKCPACNSIPHSLHTNTVLTFAISFLPVTKGILGTLPKIPLLFIY